MKRKGMGKRIAAIVLAITMSISMAGFQTGIVKAGVAEGTPAVGTPAEGTPAEGTPAEGTPAEGTPAEGTPAEETPAEGDPEEIDPEEKDPEEKETIKKKTIDSPYTPYEVYQLKKSELQTAEATVPEGYKWVSACLVEAGEGYYDFDDVVCTSEAHAHNTDCYTQDLTCGKTVHQHSDKCYGRKLVCEQGEHVHEEDCYGLVKVCNKHSHEEAGETYKACTIQKHTHIDKCYTTKKYPFGIKKKVLTCPIPEHTHQKGVCCGYVAGQSLDCKHPILHAELTFFDQKHPDECYEDVFCTKRNHTHIDSCFKKQLTCEEQQHAHDVSCYDNHALICKTEEHTHTTEDCYTPKLTCEKPEHQHSVEAGCYKWVDGEEALYNCMLVTADDDGMAELGQGNEKLSYSLTVTCKDGLPAVNAKVSITVRDYNPLAKYPTITRDLCTGIDGKIKFDYSATYDRILSVKVDDEEILEDVIYVGLTHNREYEDDYQLADHAYAEVEGTAVDPTIFEEGKYADQKCKHCGAEIKGEPIEKLTSYKVSYYMLKPGIALPDGTVSNPTKNWINLNKSIQVENDPEGSTTDKDLIAKVLGDSKDVLAEYDQTMEYNGTMFTYAKAEVFRIMKESDFDKVGYHADCRMVRGYGDQPEYAENDVFVLYVDEDGETIIDKEYIPAQSEEITVTKKLDDTYNKVKHGKNYIFSNWIDEDGNSVEVNGTMTVGDKKAIVLKASYVEVPKARFYLLYTDRNEQVPDKNMDDPVEKYTKRVVTGVLKKGVVTYEKDGTLAPEKAEVGYTCVEDYIEKGPTTDEIKILLADAGYKEEEIERYGYTIDWFRTMSYEKQDYYHVDGRVIPTTEKVKVTVYKKEGKELVGNFWVEKESILSSAGLLEKYSGLNPAEGQTLAWENEDGTPFVFGKALDEDTDVYVAYATVGGNSGGGNSGGGNSGGGNPGGSNPGGGSTPGDPGTTVIPDDDTPLAPNPGNDVNDDSNDDTSDVPTDTDDAEEITDIDDEDVPLSDGTDIDDEDVPLADFPTEDDAEVTDILDEETPLSDNPMTGDSASVLWAIMAMLSAFGLTAVAVTGKRKREE